MNLELKSINWEIGHSHDGVILLLRLESVSFFFSKLHLVIAARFKLKKPQIALETNI